MKFAAWYLLAASVCDPDAAALRASFGDNLRLIGSMPCSAQGDFNADGVPDAAWVVNATGPPPAGVRTANPWHLAATPGPRGIAVALSGSPKQLYFLADSDYFSSPIWSHPESLLTARKQGKGHILLVATESGEDMRLVFDGKAWTVRP
jgi:hypothetical protein